MMIGIEVIRELTLVCCFLESILSATNKQRVNEEIARAIHSAVQAKYVAIETHDELPEEVFIATLFNRIGSIFFWCFCGEQGEHIHALINKGCSREVAEVQILGFKLSDLNMTLSKAWKLGGLIEDSTNNGVVCKNSRAT